MSEFDDIFSHLDGHDVVGAIRWAFESAIERVLDDHSEAAGYNATSAAVNRHTLLIDRLDRVFSCERYAVEGGDLTAGLDVVVAELSENARKTMPIIPAGVVRRSGVNGSPGWAVAGHRFLLVSFPSGELQGIAWSRKSPTKQSVARQPANMQGQPTLLDALPQEFLDDLAAQSIGRSLDLPTLVLAHSLDTETGKRELVMGRAQDNRTGGSPWVWTRDMLEGPQLEENGAIAPTAPQAPATSVPDAPVRLRRQPAESTGE